ncbi:hypothetical protein [Gaoshiqia sp. Z1-71]|uniref:hypothetical protein n=1 Tax=Gaoshiqia hydrogeniformans TaxID=3290090 RepID=UPI003BF91448
MTWTSFTIAVTGCYALYYGGNILFDLIRRPSTVIGGDGNDLLQFAEEAIPVIVTALEDESNPTDAERSAMKPGKQDVNVRQRETSAQNEIIPDPLSGGLSISQLLPAIRQKAIVMTTKHDFERHSF